AGGGPGREAGEIRTGVAGLARLGIDLTEECRIPVADPARNLFVAVPRGVLDEHAGAGGRVVGGGSDGLIVAGVDLDHFGILPADRGDGAGVDASGGHED